MIAPTIEGNEKSSAAAPVRSRLLSVLGTGFGLAIIVGNTIGAGILRAPGDIAALLPIPALFFVAWALGAIYAFGGANALCELGTMIPRSGGQYHYAQRAMGRYAGFVVGWCDWLSCAGSTTAVALVFAESATVLVPQWGLSPAGFAAALIVVFTALQLRGVKEGARTQAATSLLKAVAFLVLIGACVVYAMQAGAPAAGAAPTFSRGTALLAAFVVAMQGVIYSFDGWNGVFYFSEEMQDPGRDIPRSTFGGLAAVTAIYFAVLVAFVLVVPLAALAGQPLAAGTVAGTIFGERGDVVVRVVIVLALPSAVSALLLMTSRVIHAMSVDALAPALLREVTPAGAPRVALVGSAMVSLLFLLTGTVSAVIAITAFFFVAQYAVSFAAVFVLRAKEPATPRPYRAKGHPWTTGAMLVGSIAFLAGAVASDRRNSLVALGLVVATWPVYRFFVARARGAG